MKYYKYVCLAIIKKIYPKRALIIDLPLRFGTNEQQRTYESGVCVVLYVLNISYTSSNHRWKVHIFSWMNVWARAWLSDIRLDGSRANRLSNRSRNWDTFLCWSSGRFWSAISSCWRFRHDLITGITTTFSYKWIEIITFPQQILA